MLSTLLRRTRKKTPGLVETANEPLPESSRGSSAAIQLDRIAQASVTLAALGPKLALFAAKMEAQAKLQADHASTIAATMEAVAQNLDKAVSELRSSSGELRDTLKSVSRIADHTRLLSINASIEAARAGEHGRSFAVVVDEVKRLAESSGRSTRSIEDRMQEIGGCVLRVAAVTRTDPGSEPKDDQRTVERVNRDVRGMADTASLQLQSAQSVHGMGDEINGLTESLLLALGQFRFEAHARAQGAVDRFAPALRKHMPRQAQLEQALDPFLRSHPYFELGYITDASGRQIIDNLISKEGTITSDHSGFGRDWSDRPWFRAALQHPAACSTDVYRSSATGDFCFTIAVALRGPTGELLGIFGSDVNFQRLINA